MCDTHIYPTDGYVPLQWQEFHNLVILYQQRHRGRVMKFMLYVYIVYYIIYYIYILQLILFYNVFINNLHLFMSYSLMCVFPC